MGNASKLQVTWLFKMSNN